MLRNHRVNDSIVTTFEPNDGLSWKSVRISWHQRLLFLIHFHFVPSRMSSSHTMQNYEIWCDKSASKTYNFCYDTFCVMWRNGMAPTRNLHLAIGLMVITNEPLKLGM